MRCVNRPGATPIARPPFVKRDDERGKSLRINERIRITPIRLIDHNNEQVGEVETIRALQMAKEAGLDLVEVAPTARPPVCRIMDYGKWKYQQKKKEARAKSHSKVSELKEVRLRPSIDGHHLGFKMEQAKGFLEEGHKVQFTLMFKGRQMAHKEIGYKQFQQIAEQLAGAGKIETPTRSLGRRMTMIVAPISKSEKKAKPKAEPKPPADAAAAPAPPKPAATPVLSEKPA